MKYYQERNARILVLAPKRLRENWTLYAADNDERNVLADDRLSFTVLNDTDLSRYTGYSGDVNLETLRWGNYDLIVIDESHNFRNKPTDTTKKSRYDRLYSIPFHSIPFHSIPFHSIPFHSIPFHSIPFHSIPFHSIPFHSIPFHSIPLLSSPLLLLEDIIKSGIRTKVLMLSATPVNNRLLSTCATR